MSFTRKKAGGEVLRESCAITNLDGPHCFISKMLALTTCGANCRTSNKPPVCTPLHYDQITHAEKEQILCVGKRD